MIRKLFLGVAMAAALAAPAAAIAQSDAGWRDVAPENLWVIDTTHGRVLVELMPEIAPQNVERLRVLTNRGFYDGLGFHRVIEGFMAQTGDPTGSGEGASDLPDVPGEFTFRRGRDRTFQIVENVAGQGVLGFYGALPVQTQPDAQMFVTADGRVDSIGQFCPGVVGVARGSQPNSANSQFFLMTGVNLRLSGMYTPVGMILSGQNAVQAIRKGTDDDGLVSNPDTMTRARLASELPQGERPRVRVADPRSPRFAEAVAAARAERGSRLTICDIRVPVEVL